MHQPTFNADTRMHPIATWVLVGGIVGVALGLVYYGSRLSFALGAEPTFDATLLLDVLHGALILGLGAGYAGLGLLYDKKLCYSIAAFRVYVLLDMHLIGLASGESILAALGIMLLVRGLEIAALIMLFRVGKHRFLFLGMAIWLVLRLVLDVIPGDAAAGIVGLLGNAAYVVMFALAARAARAATAR